MKLQPITPIYFVLLPRTLIMLLYMPPFRTAGVLAPLLPLLYHHAFMSPSATASPPDTCDGAGLSTIGAT